MHTVTTLEITRAPTLPCDKAQESWPSHLANRINIPDHLILAILIHLLPFSLKALLPPESQRTSSNWSSKSTLSTHSGRWCDLDLTIFSFQGITSMEEKDLVFLLQQPQKRALGTHIVHFPTFYHPLAFLFVSW